MVPVDLTTWAVGKMGQIRIQDTGPRGNWNHHIINNNPHGGNLALIPRVIAQR
jgi:hypothetical protein